MNEEIEMERLEAKVFGRVQMVMFRDFVCRSARALSCVGTAKNCPDGTVEIIAEGKKENLDTLFQRIQKGSFLSRVDDVKVEWKKPLGALLGFRIIYE